MTAPQPERPHTYSRCKACSALLLWCITVAGRRMPLDKTPARDGNILITMLPDGSIRGRVLTGSELPHEGPGDVYVPHHRTCPAGDTYRRRQDAAVPKCRSGCGYPMDPWLTQHGYAAHIGCLPTPLPRPSTAPAPAVPEPEQLPGLIAGAA